LTNILSIHPSELKTFQAPDKTVECPLQKRIPFVETQKKEIITFSKKTTQQMIRTSMRPLQPKPKQQKFCTQLVVYEGCVHLFNVMCINSPIHKFAISPPEQHHYHPSSAPFIPWP